MGSRVKNTVRTPPRGPGFQKGNPGRPKGSVNKLTAEGKELCHALVTRPKYVAWLEKQLDTGKLHPMLQAALWDRVWPKAKQDVGLSAEGGLLDILRAISQPRP